MGKREIGAYISCQSFRYSDEGRIRKRERESRKAKRERRKIEEKVEVREKEREREREILQNMIMGNESGKTQEERVGYLACQSYRDRKCQLSTRE